MFVIGTSGYHFPDWQGVFYPVDLPKEKWLEHYSTEFAAVEINMTYYGMPKQSSVERWNEETPESFSFFVKVPGDTTHKRQQNGEEILALLEALESLRTSGKLKGLLAQFPVSFHATEENREYLRSVSSVQNEVPIFAEFRHKSWDTDPAVELCRELSLGWVVTDQPPLPGMAKPRPAVCGETGYVRFHGRNSHTWYHPERGDRYDWEYSPRELSQWIPRLKALEKRAETGYLFFNNCHAGQAIKSAKLMREILQQQFEVI